MTNRTDNAPAIHEIERKFLLNRPANQIIAEAARDGTYVCTMTIEQRYLPNSGDWTVRCRRISENGFTKCFLTMKRPVTDVTSVELESSIDEEFFDKMSELAGPTLTKRRSVIRLGEHDWEIDVFENPALGGLEIAEVELGSESEFLPLPVWVGEEVTHDPQFKNVQIAKRLTL